MRVIVTGSRKWTNYPIIKETLRVMFKDVAREDIFLAHGGCRGADLMAERAATFLGVSAGNITVYPYKQALGRGGGPVRNEEMISQFGANVVVAFAHNLPSTKGTKDCVTRAIQYGIPVLHIRGAHDLKHVEFCRECGGWTK